MIRPSFCLQTLQEDRWNHGEPDSSERSARGHPERSEDKFFLVELYSDLAMLAPRSHHVRLLPLFLKSSSPFNFRIHSPPFSAPRPLLSARGSGPDRRSSSWPVFVLHRNMKSISVQPNTHVFRRSISKPERFCEKVLET